MGKEELAVEFVCKRRNSGEYYQYYEVVYLYTFYKETFGSDKKCLSFVEIPAKAAEEIIKALALEKIVDDKDGTARYVSRQHRKAAAYFEKRFEQAKKIAERWKKQKEEKIK
jgi:hypothetical protein